MHTWAGFLRVVTAQGLRGNLLGFTPRQILQRLWDVRVPLEAQFSLARPGGFALDADDAPHLRGLVDLYDGARHMSQCLIVASAEEAGEMVYEFKRETPALDAAPLDYQRDPDAPVALPNLMQVMWATVNRSALGSMIGAIRAVLSGIDKIQGAGDF